MSDFTQTDVHEAPTGRPASRATSESLVAGDPDGIAEGPPLRPGSTDSVPTSAPVRRPSARRLLTSKRRRWIAAVAALTCGVIGLSIGIATSGSSKSAPPVASGSAGGIRSGGGGSNARSGPTAGGASGTVASVSASSFTMNTAVGQKVTVDEASSTTYQNGTNPTPANAITTGSSVLVLGTTSGTTIKATQVIVQPTAGSGSAASSAAGVIPFQRGAPTTSKPVGQIPADYSQGSGTIVRGTTANKATEAALAAYPGGVVDRVVQLGNGDFEVHYIGVNWPHHIFVNHDFNVIGAN